MTHIPPALISHRGQCVDVGSCVFVVVKLHCGYVRAYVLLFIYEWECRLLCVSRKVVSRVRVLTSAAVCRILRHSNLCRIVW